MSKNYTNYSKPDYKTEPVNTSAVDYKTEPVVEPEEPKTIIAAPEVEPEEPKTVTAAPVAEPEEPKTVTGTVTSPKPKLNVRRQPLQTGKVLGVIDNGSKVKIDLDNSTTEWYKVSSESGLEGYCMKQFIAVK